MSNVDLGVLDSTIAYWCDRSDMNKYPNDHDNHDANIAIGGVIDGLFDESDDPIVASWHSSLPEAVMLGIRLAVGVVNGPLDDQADFVDGQLSDFRSKIAELATSERDVGAGSHIARARFLLNRAETAAANAKALIDEVSPLESK